MVLPPGLMLKTAASSDLTNLRGMKVGLLTIQSLKRLRRQHIQDWVKRHRVTFTEPQQASYQHHTHTYTHTHSHICTHTHTHAHTHTLTLLHTHTHTYPTTDFTGTPHTSIPVTWPKSHLHTTVPQGRGHMHMTRPKSHRHTTHTGLAVTPPHHTHRTGSRTITPLTQGWQSQHRITHTGLAVTPSHYSHRTGLSLIHI